MTIQDIKKALEICSEDDGCRECPYYDYHRCDKALLKDALALITEQNQKYQEQQLKQAQIDVLNKLKDSYGLYYLSAFGVKERMLADILNPMIEELKK